MVFANRLDRMRQVLKSEYGSADGQIALVLQHGQRRRNDLHDALRCALSFEK